jgi:hypothetical protein
MAQEISVLLHELQLSTSNALKFNCCTLVFLSGVVEIPSTTHAAQMTRRNPAGRVCLVLRHCSSVPIAQLPLRRSIGFVPTADTAGAADR